MAQSDVETIRSGLAALNRRDIDGMLATLRADVELVPLRAVLDGTVYTGHDGLRRWLTDMTEDWDEFQIDVHDVRALDDGRVLVLARFQARGSTSGVRVDWPAAWICRMTEGKVAHVQFYADAEAALAAADTPAASEI
jgi:ketosteroid isomerase-like protein